MKILNKIGFIVAAAATLTSVSSCKKLLVEQPRAALYPDYFTTASGVAGGITGVYNDLRSSFFAGERVDWYNGCDESVYGTSSSTGGINLDSYSGVNSSNATGFSNLWSDINTLNGVLQYAPAANIPAATKTQYIAQAKFLRAWMYFWLVQTFGGTTATQKSGIPIHTTFLTAATSADAPAPMADIYKLIIGDLTDAIAGLPNTIIAGNTFSNNGIGKTATVAVAKAYLAKVYLTRGYLSEVADAGDFQKAADLTQEIITNKATYGLDLFQDFNDAQKEANDYGKENMFAIDYGVTDPNFSGYVSAGGQYGINMIPVLWRYNYISAGGIDNTAGIDAAKQVINTSKNPMQRDVYNGRPYIRVAPNGSYINTIFADQVHDTRWDATFQTFWINNVKVAAGVTSTGGLKGVLTPTSNFSQTSYNIPVDGDTAILMPGVEVDMARRDAFKGLIVTPKQYSNNVYPVVKKYDEILRTYMNDFSGRPIVLLRFSEIYLMNAEANYMLGNTNAAATSLNVIRQRAAYRVPADANQIPKGQFRVTTATQAAANATNAAAMALTGAQLAQLAIPNNTTSTTTACGMDLILDEYSRELFAEPNHRWYDLVRTQQLVRRVKMWNPNGGPNVQPYHMRRPIPQGQIDAVLTGPKYPQNNGY